MCILIQLINCHGYGKVQFCSFSFQMFNAARSSFAPEEEKRQMLEDLVKVYGEH